MKMEQFGSLGMGDYLRLLEERAEKEGLPFDRSQWIERTIEEVQDPAHLFYMLYDFEPIGFVKVRLDRDLWVEDIYLKDPHLAKDFQDLVKNRLEEVSLTWNLDRIHWSDNESS